MSDFLLNLARRSAGLAPVVRARASMPAAAAQEPDAPAPAARTAAREPGAVPAAMSAPAAPIAPIAPAADAPRIAMPALPANAAPSAAPLVQRALASAATPAPSPIAPPAAPVAEPAPVAAPSAPAETARAAEPTPRQAAPALDDTLSTPRAAPQPAPTNAPAILPAAIVRVEPLELVPRPALPRENDGEVTRIVERTQASPAGDVPSPVAVTIQPAEIAAAAPPAPSINMAPERTVHVRIGAIEIVGAEPELQAMAPAAPAAPPMAPRAAPAGGFEEYSSLRRYAPWSW